MKNDVQAPKGPPVIDGWYVADDPFPADAIARLVYYARLAPSTHNTQPWKFVASRSEIDVFADTACWLRAADADQRELHVSLGCAIEALRIAADFAGYGSRVEYFPLRGDETLVARVSIQFAGPKREQSAGDLLKPMLTRRTAHRPFDPARTVSAEQRRRLANSFEIEDVSIHFLDERGAIEQLAALEARAVVTLFARPEYREELAQWIGAGTSGRPWLASKLGQFAAAHLPVGKQVAQADAGRLASAPLVALLATQHNRRVDQLRAGEAFIRVALTAEARALRVQPVTQTLRLPDACAEVNSLFGVPERFAQQLFRIGEGDAETRRPVRRPLESMLIRP